MFDVFLCIWYTIFMKKDMFTINKNGLSYGRGYVYSLQYHLVWCTKYRKKVLKDGIDVECKEMLESLAQEYKFQILAMEVMPDHIHLLVDCRPQFYISDMIKIMKGNLARQMFRCIETFLTVLNLGQFFPYRFIHFDQIADSRTVNLQCLADWNILFS